MSYARELLHDTDMTLSKIAAAAGFDAYRTFFRSFKRVLGLSPRTLREQNVHRRESVNRDSFLPTSRDRKK